MQISIHPENNDTDVTRSDLDWSLTQLHKNIYQIVINNTQINWLLKVFKCPNHKEFSSNESCNLRLLKGVEGIPKVLAESYSTDFDFLIISRLPGEALTDYLKTNGSLTESEIKPIVISLLKIIRQIHLRKIVHCDIKPDNIMYDKASQQVGIIDFEQRHTTEYASPEQLRNCVLSPKTDLWSLGISIYVCLTNEFPFNDRNEVLRKKIVWPSTWSEELQDFMASLIERDEYFRYDVDDALNHAWISD